MRRADCHVDEQSAILARPAGAEPINRAYMLARPSSIVITTMYSVVTVCTVNMNNIIICPISSRHARIYTARISVSISMVAQVPGQVQAVRRSLHPQSAYMISSSIRHAHGAACLQ